jgi:hypothetical protein
MALKGDLEALQNNAKNILAWVLHEQAEICLPE